ncbi:MAG: GNAT family N-acetyltransferase [Demequinaceae bacterium]|nr:GNAT family N-acetyltransferase [Demequinaceae bacterium]
MTLSPVDGAQLDARTDFLAVAAAVYRDDAGWAPASEHVIAARAEDAAAGRIQMHGFVASAGGRPVARAAAIIEPDAVTTDGRPEGWIGLFECVRGEDEAGMGVLGACAQWLRERGREAISAPRVDALVSGLVTSGFDESQVVFTPYNPDYYPDIFAAAGFTTTTRMHAYRFDAATAPHIRVPPRLGAGVRGVRLDDWDGELARLHAFQEAAFGGHVARLSRGLGATDLLARRLVPVLDPDLCLIAEDRHGATVGFLLCLPDAWQSRPKGASPRRARLVSIGVAPTWRGKGAALAMGATLEKRLLDKGFESLEASWILSDNERPRTLVRALGGSATRSCAVYELAD